MVIMPFIERLEFKYIAVDRVSQSYKGVTFILNCQE